MGINGVGIQLNYKKAYIIFRTLAENGDAEACNAIGMMFRYGIGLKQNDEKAHDFFQKAADRGYAKAAYNIGLLYKNGHGVEQDLSLSMNWFEKANEMGYKNTNYRIGYAYYKGQGKTQSYSNSFQFFQKGAEEGNANCMYMLSLCYFKGRGVERNIEQGKYWIEQAANKGLSKAVDMMARNDSRTFGAKKPFLRSSQNDVMFDMIPTKHLRVANDNAIIEQDITGEWEGNLVQYDWSGEEIEYESKLKVVFDKEGDTIYGLWMENDSLITSISATLKDSTWVFDNVVLHEQARPLDMKNGNFTILHKDGKEYLTGNVAFYSEAIREYTAPNYMVLEHKNNNVTSIDNVLKDNQINVFPNPFNDRLTVEMTLDKPQNIRIVIYDASGKRIETGELQTYNAGTHRTEIQTGAYPHGNYILRVVGDNINKSIVVIK
jgi:TPR repeat protein